MSIYGSFMKYLLFAGLLLAFMESFAQSNDTFRVYFPFNDSLVDKQAGAALDSLLENNVLIPGQKLVILGFTDYVGGKRYNNVLSMARATHVRDYLLSSGFESADIKLSMGMASTDIDT